MQNGDGVNELMNMKCDAMIAPHSDTFTWSGPLLLLVAKECSWRKIRKSKNKIKRVPVLG